MRIEDVKNKDDVMKYLEEIAESTCSIGEFYARAKAMLEHCEKIGVEWPEVCVSFKQRVLAESQRKERH